MKKIKTFVKALGIILLLAAASLLSDDSVLAAESTTAVVSVPDNIRSIRKSNKAIRLEWKGVPEVDGYVIYRYRRSSKKYIKIHTVKGTKANQWMKWTDKHLKTNKIYKYKMASYRIVNGQKRISNISDWVSAKTYQRKSRKINARAPKLSPKKVNLGLCSRKETSCYVPAAKYGKHKKKTPFSKKVRWYSSDTAVATVTAKGVITAGVRPGTCYIYAKAHNGLRSRIKVVVKNYARVSDYYGKYLQEDDIYILVTEYKTQIQNIAEYYSINRVKPNAPIQVKRNSNAEAVITPANADIGNLQKDIETLLVDFPYHISIIINADFVEFNVQKQDNKESLKGHVRFWFDNDCSDWGTLQAAPHWEAFRFRPI